MKRERNSGVQTRAGKKQKYTHDLLNRIRENLGLAYHEYHYGDTDPETRKRIRKLVLEEIRRRSVNSLRYHEKWPILSVLSEIESSNLSSLSKNQVENVSDKIFSIAQGINEDYSNLQKLLNINVLKNHLKHRVNPILRGYSRGNEECEASVQKCDNHNNSEMYKWWVEEYMNLWNNKDVVTAAFLISCLLVTEDNLFDLSRKNNYTSLRGNRVYGRVNKEFSIKYREYARNLKTNGRQQIYNDQKGTLKTFTENLSKLEFIDSQTIILPMFLLAFGRSSGSCMDNAILKYRDTQGDVFVEDSHFACISTSCPLTRGTAVRTYPTWPTSQCKDHIRVPPGPQAFLVLTFGSMIRHINNQESKKRICPVFNAVLSRLCPDYNDRKFVKYVVMGRCKPPAN
jgi:hypothetical protein